MNKAALSLSCFCLAGALALGTVRPAAAQVRFLDLSKAANMGPAESFDEVLPDVRDLRQKEGMGNVPSGPQTFRGIPFLILDAARNNGDSFIALRGRRKKDFPQAVDIPAGGLKAAYLYFFHTCRWGGTPPRMTVAEYDVIYEDGGVAVIPLRVGVELTNFWGSDDTSASYVGWWHHYKNAGMGINVFPWKNPRPDIPIQSILFKSEDRMPVPVLFAVTACGQELPISAQSPKPEKTFETDTRHWRAFPPSEAGATQASIQGTALDLGSLLDAPAGKHGKVEARDGRLVFADGTPARFWGLRLAPGWEDWSSEKTSRTADRLAAYGCNLVAVDGDGPKALAALPSLVSVLKKRGVYVLLEGTPDKPAADASPVPSATPAAQDLFSDPAVIPSSLVSMGGSPGDALSPPEGGLLAFQDLPRITQPADGPLCRAVLQRSFQSPFLAQWAPDWPNEYMAEQPLLWSVYAGLEDWSGVLAGDMDGGGWDTALAPGRGLNDKPPLLLQWPAAALAYLRGYLEKGRVLVLKPGERDAKDRLKALAHRTGLGGEGVTFETDTAGLLKAEVREKLKSLVSDTSQVQWQGNIGLVRVSSTRFQALVGFLGHQKLKSPVWEVESSNPFASLSLVSLDAKTLWASDHMLVTGVTRMENTAQVYNAAKSKLLDRGRTPILFEPLKARITLFRYHRDAHLRVRALDADGHPLNTRVPSEWHKNSWTLSWVPGAFYLEIYKPQK